MISLKTSNLLCAVAATLLIAVAPASAQPNPDRRDFGPGWGPGKMMGPGMMRGPGMWNSSGFGGMCNPRMAGFAEWRVEQIERAVKPNDAQKKALEDLRAASTKAAETITAACPRDIPATAPARLAFMEARMEAMLQAVKTVRPAFDAFYGALSDEQKARLDATGPRRWGWSRWRQGGQ